MSDRLIGNQINTPIGLFVRRTRDYGRPWHRLLRWDATWIAHAMCGETLTNSLTVRDETTKRQRRCEMCERVFERSVARMRT